MFRRNVIPVWLGIILLSGMFLMGQDTWPPPPEPLLPLEAGKIWQDTHTPYIGTSWTGTMEVIGKETRCSNVNYYRVTLCNTEKPDEGCEDAFFRSDEENIYQCDGGNECALFRIDVSVGTEWECDGTYITRLPNEAVSVPYGDFPDAYHFHMDEGPGVPDCELWFHVVPGVGIVSTRDECNSIPHVSELVAICDDPNPGTPGDTCP